MYLVAMPLLGTCTLQWFNVPSSDAAGRNVPKSGWMMYLTAAFFLPYRAISLDRGFKSKNAMCKQSFPKLELSDCEKKNHNERAGPFKTETILYFTVSLRLSISP